MNTNDDRTPPLHYRVQASSSNLADEDLADQDWEAWDMGDIDDQVALVAWLVVCFSHYAKSNSASRQ